MVEEVGKGDSRIQEQAMPLIQALSTFMEQCGPLPVLSLMLPRNKGPNVPLPEEIFRSQNSSEEYSVAHTGTNASPHGNFMRLEL